MVCVNSGSISDLMIKNNNNNTVSEASATKAETEKDNFDAEST